MHRASATSRALNRKFVYLCGCYYLDFLRDVFLLQGDVGLIILFLMCVLIFTVLFFFFFQAEDGIRDLIVTGVQTCALPISSRRRHTRSDRDWSSDVCSSDLKSTRLNSSHDQISYAVFCL